VLGLHPPKSTAGSAPCDCSRSDFDIKTREVAAACLSEPFQPVMIHAFIHKEFYPTEFLSVISASGRAVKMPSDKMVLCPLHASRHAGTQIKESGGV